MEPESELSLSPSTGVAGSFDDIQLSSCVDVEDLMETSRHNRDDLHPYEHTGDIDSMDYFPIPASLWSLPFYVDDDSQQSFLWSYFVFRGSKIFLCWDTEKMGSNVLIDDPYTTTLTAVAAHSRPFYLAALALSAFLYSMDYPGVLPSTDVSRFRQQTLSALKNTTRKSTEISVDIILARLIMSLLDMDDGRNSFSLELGSRVTARCWQRRQPDYGQSDSVSDVALHLLRWTYICKQVSFSNEPESADDAAWRALEFRDEELETPLRRQFSHWVIHPLYTVSHRWINPLLKLGRLVSLRRQARKFSGVSLPEDFEDQIGQLENEILVARGRDLLVFLRGSGDLADLLCLNEAIHSAILLTFYTRLRDMAWTNSFVRQQARKVCEYAEAIDKCSRTLNNIVFPVFLAGCEAADTETRERIVSLLSGLHPWGFWFHQEFKLLASLQQVWLIRDEMPGASWPEWSQRGLSPFYCSYLTLELLTTTLVLLDNVFCIPI